MDKNNNRDIHSNIPTLNDITNTSISVDPLDLSKYNQNNKRRKVSKIPLMSSTTTTIVKNGLDTNNNFKIFYQDSKIQRDKINKLKNDKQDELYYLNKKIWELQAEISSLNLKIELSISKLSDVKLEFKSLESKFINLKKDSHLLLLKEVKSYKSNLMDLFNKKINNISNDYQIKAQKYIDINTSKFNSSKTDLLNHIKILENTLLEYSDDILKNKQNSIKLNFENQISELLINHSKNLNTMNLEMDSTNLSISDLKSKIDNLILKRENENKLKLNNLSVETNILNSQLDDLKQNDTDLNNILKSLNNSKDDECNRLLTLKENCRQFQNDVIQINNDIKQEEQLRRFLHNKLQELKGNIRVFCRIKPELNTDKVFNHKIHSLLESLDLKESLTITEPNSNTNKSPMKKNVPKNYTFSFDKIFDENSTNGDIFEEISQLIQSSIDGFNVCIFTYGQTGSGKTFTMSNKNDGLIPRSMNQLFERIEILKSSLNKNYKLYGQFFEIYHDNLRDLIDSNYSTNQDDIDLTNIINKDLSNIKIINLTSINQINELLNHTNEKRVTAATMANDVSSRSHSIFKIIIANEENVKIGELNLVDLAGSERLSQSQVKGIRLKETLSINKSLSSLGDVISSLKIKNNHIPYRNSKLTYILRDSLGGDSKTLMFVNISSLTSHFNESLSSLRFASKVNNTALK